jgi:hypothetical protein
MTTVMVNEGIRKNGAHHHIERITDLERLIASLETTDLRISVEDSGEIPAETAFEIEAESLESDD